MNYLLALLSPFATEKRNRIPPTIRIDEEIEASESESLSPASTAQPTCLTNNPSYLLANNPTTQPSNTPTNQSDEDASLSSDESKSTLNSNQRSMDQVNANFAREFGQNNTINELWELEANRATVLRPLLESR